jgi:hypothetical protein
MFYLQTAATEAPVGSVAGYTTRAEAVIDGEVIAFNMDTPIDVVEIRDADRIYPCGCSDDIPCDDHADQ